ncbi:hypothetical protein N0V90_009755 [Kalmusia sp. IMI 367209]|nr:hypothetical protein N0V90_009755 [Kalmusia sp. IMI 367209]
MQQMTSPHTWRRHHREASNIELKDYDYQPLNEEAQEIRLVRLLPGVHKELEIEIFHVPLIQPEPAQDNRLSIDEVQATLPQSWGVYETLEGRYLYWNNLTGTSEWEHPVKNVKKELIESSAILDPYPDFQLKFEALSYAWGDGEANAKLTVISDDSAMGLSALYVRPNLYNALKQLRDSQSERTLWIDALCINQDDLQERNHEVKRMSQIYTLASKVIVWLGTENPDGSSARALDIFGFFGEQFELTADWLLLISPLWASRNENKTAFPSAFADPQMIYALYRGQRKGVSPLYTESDFRSIQEILTRSWWDRLWIWQEVLLGNHRTVVQCGSISLSWYYLRRSIAVFIAYGQGLFGPSYTSALFRRRYSLCVGLKTSPLLRLLDATHKTQYSEKHDRIYALLGLMSPEDRAHITVDYSVDLDHLFQSICVAIIWNTGLLEFFKYCDLSDQRENPTKPSWVPDWNQNRLDPLVNGCAFAYGETTLDSSSYTINGPELIVPTIICGTVEHVTAAIQADANPAHELWEEVVKSPLSNITSSQSKQDFITMLLCGFVRDLWPEYIHLPTIDEAMDDYHNGATKMYEYAQGRSFVRSSDGKVGLCPSSALPGEYRSSRPIHFVLKE